MNKLIRTATMFIMVAVIFTMTTISCKELLTEPVQLLVITNDQTGEVYFSEPLEDDGVFSVSYTHSVNKSDVREYYRLEEGQITLIKARYHHFGAGVATEVAPEQRFYYDDDGFMIIDDIHTTIPKLTYKVGTVSDPIVHIGDNAWHLKALAPSLTSVRFEIMTQS